jgi:hypothetical protein
VRIVSASPYSTVALTPCVATPEGRVPLDKLIVLLLPDPANEALAGLLLSQPVCCKTVLGEAEVEEGCDVDVCCCKLLLLLGEVRATDKANGNLVAELREQLKHLWLDELRR